MTEWYRTGGLQEVGNRFDHRFPGRSVPVKSTIWKKVRQYQREGTSLNLNMLVQSQPFRFAKTDTFKLKMQIKQSLSLFKSKKKHDISKA